ncbi:MAG: dockerin type I domain-containing protein, partial [Dehalococcoidia bacterium]
PWGCGPGAQALFLSWGDQGYTYLHGRGCASVDQDPSSSLWRAWASTTSTGRIMVYVYSRVQGRDRCGQYFDWQTQIDVEAYSPPNSNYMQTSAGQGNFQSCGPGGDHLYDVYVTNSADLSYFNGVSMEAAGLSNAPSFFLNANRDAKVDAIDALCVLRAVAQLPATSTCPIPLPRPDANQDGVSSPLDALCILRYVAAFSGSTNCPDAPKQVPPGASPFNAPTRAPVSMPARVPGRTPISPSSSGGGPLDANSVQIFLAPSSVNLSNGQTTVFTLQATLPVGVSLGAWTIDVGYLAPYTTAVDCSGANVSSCNTTFDSQDIRLTGTSTAGLSGTVTLGTVTLEDTDVPGWSDPVYPQVSTLADPSGNPLPSNVTDAWINTQ